MAIAPGERPSAELAPGLPPRRPPAVCRVLHVVNGEHYAGAERVQDLLALVLPEFGFEVGFACLKPQRFPSLRRARQAPLHAVPMRSRFDLSPALALARRIRSDGYALVHTHTPRAALVGGLAARLAGVPLVHHLHSPTTRDTTSPWRNRFNSAVERLGLRRARALIAVSESLADWARQHGFPPGRVSVVANGVPTRQLTARPRPAGEWMLGVVALFRPRKGVEVLLEALALLWARSHRFRLVAVGGFETPGYETALRARAGELGLSDRIEWRGFQEDVSAELARMDALVLPSLFGEGLPMVVLEAMAAGVPIVASRVEGVPEAVRDGQDGLLVEPGSPGALAAALARLMSGEVDWEGLRLAAHRRQRQSFSDRSMAAGVAEVYRRVLDR